MDMISRVGRRAEEALVELRSQAAEEGWDAERIEKEKSLFELRHEVSLCCTPGCTNMAEPIPGFADLLCQKCQCQK